MKSKSTPAAVPAKTPASRRETVAARKARELAERAQAERDFHGSRSLHWAELWGRVLRVKLILTEFEKFAQDERHWVKRTGLAVDLRAQAFHMCPSHGAGQVIVTPANLDLELFEGLVFELNSLEQSFEGFYQAEEAERERLAHEEKLRSSGKAKLTPEEQRALGIR